MRNYLIPVTEWDQLRKLSVEELRNQFSQVVVDNEGHYIATIMVPQTDFIKMQTEYAAQLSNAVKPKESPPVEQLEEEEFPCPECERSFPTRMGLTAHMRAHKKVVANAAA